MFNKHENFRIQCNKNGGTTAKPWYRLQALNIGKLRLFITVAAFYFHQIIHFTWIHDRSQFRKNTTNVECCRMLKTSSTKMRFVSSFLTLFGHCVFSLYHRFVSWLSYFSSFSLDISCTWFWILDFVLYFLFGFHTLVNFTHRLSQKNSLSIRFCFVCCILFAAHSHEIIDCIMVH